MTHFADSVKFILGWLCYRAILRVPVNLKSRLYCWALAWAGWYAHRPATTAETSEACWAPTDPDQQAWGWVDSLINGARWVFLAAAIVFTLALAAGYVVGRGLH